MLLGKYTSQPFHRLFIVLKIEQGTFFSQLVILVSQNTKAIMTMCIVQYINMKSEPGSDSDPSTMSFGFSLCKTERHICYCPGSYKLYSPTTHSPENQKAALFINVFILFSDWRHNARCNKQLQIRHQSEKRIKNLMNSAAF